MGGEEEAAKVESCGKRRGKVKNDTGGVDEKEKAAEVEKCDEQRREAVNEREEAVEDTA